MSEAMLELADSSLCYIVRGSGPVLLLVSPGGSGGEAFAPVVSHLSGAFTVVTYDRAGYRRSPRKNHESAISIEQHAHDAAQLLRSLTADPALVFGSSAGAVVALELLRLHAAQVRHVVAHEPPLISLLTAAEKAQSGAEKQQFEEAFRTKGPQAALHMLASKLGGAHDSPGREMTDDRRANASFFFRQEAPAIDAYRVDLDELTAHRDRVSVAAGEESAGLMPFNCAQRLSEYLGTQLQLYPGGHSGFATHASQFSALLTSTFDERRAM